MAKFAYNKSMHSSTAYSPFLANIGYHVSWMMLNVQISQKPYCLGAFIATKGHSSLAF
jgi:hypothetical protein